MAAAIYLADGFPSRASDALAYNSAPDPAQEDLQRVSRECLAEFSSVFRDEKDLGRMFCEQRGEGKTEIFILGDSHAGKLYEALAVRAGGHVTHLGKGSCPPILDMNPADKWYACQPFNNKVLDFVLNSDARVVILTGVFERYFDGSYISVISSEEVRLRVKNWYRVLSNFHGNVYVVLDNPALPFEPKTCELRLININRNQRCSFDRNEFEVKTRTYREIFKAEAENFRNVKVFDPTAVFCDQHSCYGDRQGMLYAGDNNHVSTRGAKLVIDALLLSYPGIY